MTAIGVDGVLAYLDELVVEHGADHYVTECYYTMTPEYEGEKADHCIAGWVMVKAGMTLPPVPGNDTGNGDIITGNRFQRFLQRTNQLDVFTEEAWTVLRVAQAIQDGSGDEISDGWNNEDREWGKAVEQAREVAEANQWVAIRKRDEAGDRVDAAHELVKDNELGL